jgi:uncharacterized repeat protein (TIGR01451 family)
VVLTKVVNNSTPNIGETVTYTVTVTNKGTTLVTNLVVKDDLPAGLTFVSATPVKRSLDNSKLDSRYITAR